jgi:hypothetical protein
LKEEKRPVAIERGLRKPTIEVKKEERGIKRGKRTNNNSFWKIEDHHYQLKVRRERHQV